MFLLRLSKKAKISLDISPITTPQYQLCDFDKKFKNYPLSHTKEHILLLKNQPFGGVFISSMMSIKSG